MRISPLKHFDMIATLIALAALGLVHGLVFAVPGFQSILALLIVLGVISAYRMVMSQVVEVNPSKNAENLHSALDFARDGIAMLDPDLRVVYANREFRRLFCVPDALADSKPQFAAIVAQGRKSGVYDVDAESMDSFCAQRVAFVRSGSTQPVTLRLADGAMIRFTCNVMPDGGRMLTYTNVTDLVNDAERLEELAHIDGMTGLANRRRLLDIANRSWPLAVRYERPTSLLMIDIDHFKAVNDTYGHDIGDLAIRHVADICKDSKRATDTAARVGGEEFALWLPETDLEGALVLAERIRTRVAANVLNFNGGSTRLTVSIGAAQRQTDTPDFTALLKMSDELLYKAKRGGRNRVECELTPDNDVPNQTAVA